MRIGEINGLQWKYVDVSEETIAANSSCIYDTHELKRCNKADLKLLEERGRVNVYYRFPELKENCSTCLVLTDVKTDSSVRRVYVPETVARALLEHKKKQEAHIAPCHGLYNDYDLVLAQDNGKGVINILDSSSLINDSKLYSTFLLWMISELFETLPEVGDLDKPKMIFFFDEAHLLFADISKALLEKIEQVVKLIRSKGVGVYFCTQNPKDIPDSVIAQLGNKVQHGLRAFTPADQTMVRAAADAFRVNPDFDTYDTILNLGTGEAVISFLGEDGIPGIVQKASVLPPRTLMGAVSDAERDAKIKSSILYSKYANAVDPDSAFEFLQRKGIEDAEAAAALAEQQAAEKAAEKEAKAAEKEAEKKAKAEAKAAEREEAKKRKAANQVGNTMAGTVGREVGKIVGSNFGKFGKTLGGNVGAQLARGIFGTFLKK